MTPKPHSSLPPDYWKVGMDWLREAVEKNQDVMLGPEEARALVEQLEASVVQEHETFQRLRESQEQFEALRLVVMQQLTPLDVAATHIDIIRRKGDDYSAQERDKVASIVEAHVSEARSALFAAISNPATDSLPRTGASERVGEAVSRKEGGLPNPASSPATKPKKPN